MNCVFCKICSHELPGKIIYQDTIISCFLPRKAEVYGHLLIAPNKHYENIFDIPEAELSHIAQFTKKISIHLKERLGATGINILHARGLSAQQSVLHFHIHILPRFDNDGLDTWPRLEKKEYNREEIFEKIKF